MLSSHFPIGGVAPWPDSHFQLVLVHPSAMKRVLPPLLHLTPSSYQYQKPDLAEKSHLISFTPPKMLISCWIL